MRYLLALVAVATAYAQLGPPPAKPKPPRNAKEAAPVDFTGYWVSVVTEDWRWRMVTPAKGDFASIPLTAEGRAARQRLGSGEGRSRGRTVPGLRRPSRHANSRAATYHLGGR